MKALLRGMVGEKFWGRLRRASEDLRETTPLAEAGSFLQGRDVVFLGPWLGEVGPEIGYWIPFLRKLNSDGAFEGRRLIVISRGGVKSWYSGLPAEYIDLHSLLSLEDFRALRLRQSGHKQLEQTRDEDGVVAKAADQLGLAAGGYATFHPSRMYKHILLWLSSRKELEWLLDRIAFAPFAPPDPVIREAVDRLGLPPRFSFVKFYSSELFPRNAVTADFGARLVAGLRRHGPVVTAGLIQSTDDHEHLTADGVIDVSDRLAIETNLGVQTEILRRSEGYFGTYGGFSVLPAFVGKPSISFVSTPLRDTGMHNLHFRHEAITVEMFRQAGQPYQVLNIEAFQLINHYLNNIYA